MDKTPKSLRLQIALLGKVNSGKSSFLNLVAGQDVSITSPVEGTTTDVVEKNQELQPIGPVTWLDTAGFGDESELGKARIDKTLKVLERANVALLVLEGDKISPIEASIVNMARELRIPLIKIYNKYDLYPTTKTDGIIVNSTHLASRDVVLGELKKELIKACPDRFIEQKLLGDLAPENSTVIMLIPIDFEAPKGRLIMPQVQAIRDCLDSNQTTLVVKDNSYINALNNLKTPPSLVVCDSQVVDFMVKNTPRSIKCTTFSILFARAKGDILKFVEGAAKIKHLKDGDKVLIAECCTHHASNDDIGKVKIPKWLKEYTGKNLDIDFVSSHDFPKNLQQYQLVIQCGGCMFNRREILSRINICENAGVPITNYGVCISELKGVLERVLEPFPDALVLYKGVKNGQN